MIPGPFLSLKHKARRGDYDPPPLISGVNLTSAQGQTTFPRLREVILLTHKRTFCQSQTWPLLHNNKDFTVPFVFIKVWDSLVSCFIQLSDFVSFFTPVHRIYFHVFSSLLVSFSIHAHPEGTEVTLLMRSIIDVSLPSLGLDGLRPFKV